MQDFQYLVQLLLQNIREISFKDLINPLTLLVITWTAYETFRARMANNKAVELTTLPVLMIDFKKDGSGNYVPFIKNLRDVPAYDVSIESWSMNFMDMQIAWSMEIKDKGINLVDGEAEKELSLIFKENGKTVSKDSNPIIMSSFFHSGLTLAIEYKNFIGERYYTIIKTLHDPITEERLIKMVKPPTKYDWYLELYKMGNIIKSLALRGYLKIIWKFDKPHFGNKKIKYDLISVIVRWLKSKQRPL